MKGLLQKLLPRKNRFIGIELGSCQVKLAELKVSDGLPLVASLKSMPSPPHLWSGEFDEELLVQILQGVTTGLPREVITCLGGESVIGRVVCFPLLCDRELETAAALEAEKFLPASARQFVIRQVRLGEGLWGERGDAGGQLILILAAPLPTVYRFYGIFSRAGLLLTAIDHQAFALWRLFGRNSRGIAALLDLGHQVSHLVVVREGLICFARLLPLGGEKLTRALMEAMGVEAGEARRMKEEATVQLEGRHQGSVGRRIGEVLRGGLMEIAGELQRSLSYFAAQERTVVERVVVSGGTSKLQGLVPFLEEVLGMTVMPGVVDLEMEGNTGYDPSFATALGLALRGVNGL